MGRIQHTLVMGVAGTGKSTLAETLKERKILAIDGDYDQGIAYWKNKKTAKVVTNIHSIFGFQVKFYEWRWNIDRLSEFLDHSVDPVTVCGTADNRHEAYDLFSNIFVLTCAQDIISDRLKTRTNNSFGKLSSHRKQVALDNIEMLDEAKQNGFHIIDTTGLTPSQVADHVLSTK